VPESFPKIGHFKSIADFQAYLASLNLDLPCDSQIISAGEGSPLGRPLVVDEFKVGNRWCIHPMEGWDATTGGEPTDFVLRRWSHFGQSGAKLIWGGEAFAVQGDGRANPNQLCHFEESITEKSLHRLISTLMAAHRESFDDADDLFIGLQLTHSGRFCRPRDKARLEPRIAYHHPLLDAKFNIDPGDDSVVISDDYLKKLIDAYVAVAGIAAKAGFHFVDIKHCHGYLGHEMLSAFTRPGAFGGSFENRTRFAREIVAGIGATSPRLRIGVRLSAFDHPPFRADGMVRGQPGPGVPHEFQNHLPYLYAFGVNPQNPLEPDLTEPIAFIQMLRQLDVKLVNISCCSPYYNPHFQRPAIYPPSDGYQPPEDPLIGVARQIQVTRQLKEACPGSIFVGSGYTYLQEYLPQVAQAIVRNDWTDFVGIGRLVLSYWQLPADTLAGRGLQDKRICRTFSDCTTAPRGGLISGCFPLDPFYRELPQAAQLKEKKAATRKSLPQA
jgi:NADPH2 dehydrogenase